MDVDLDYRAGSVPLYVQLADAVQLMIDRSKMQPGDLLPSETELARQHQLSRATVIKAFDLLVDRGQVVRKQGKGTFVAVPAMRRDLPELTSFTQHIKSIGGVPGSELLAFSVHDGHEFELNDFMLPAHLRLAKIERLRLVDSSPVGVHRTLVPEEICERIGLTEQVAAGADYSLYEQFERSNISIAIGEERLRAVSATQVEARLLGVPKGTALMEATRASYDAGGALLEIVRARYVGSRYEYLIHLSASSQVEPSTGGGGMIVVHRESERR